MGSRKLALDDLQRKPANSTSHLFEQTAAKGQFEIHPDQKAAAGDRSNEAHLSSLAQRGGRTVNSGTDAQIGPAAA